VKAVVWKTRTRVGGDMDMGNTQDSDGNEAKEALSENDSKAAS
jgi:hypothetical protein